MTHFGPGLGITCELNDVFKCYRTSGIALLPALGVISLPSQSFCLMACFSMELPWWFSGKEPACKYRRPGFDPWVGKIPEEGNGNSLQYSSQENPMDGGAWQATVHGVTKNQIQLSDFTFTFSFTLALASFKPSSPHHPERRTMAQSC